MVRGHHILYNLSVRGQLALVLHIDSKSECIRFNLPLNGL